MSEIQLLRLGIFLILTAFIAFIVFLILSLVISREDKRIKRKTLNNDEVEEKEKIIKQSSDIFTYDEMIGIKRRQTYDDDFDNDLESKIVNEAGKITGGYEQTGISKQWFFLHNDVSKIVIGKEKMFAVKKGSNIKDVLNYMIENNVSHCPVYQRGIDDILGVVKIKVLLKKYLNRNEADNSTFNWEDGIEMPPFISRSISIIDAFSQMKQRRSNIAIVIDEYAQTIGIITEQDIINGIIKPINEQETKI